MYRQIIPDWQPGPLQFGTPPAFIDIWRIPFGSVTHDPALDGRRQVRQAMQEILSRYLAVSADALRIEPEPGGKPRLVAPPVALHFNLSHCRDLAVLAVSGAYPVGIDVEQSREIGNLMRIAERALTSRDIDALNAASPEQRLALFLERWTQLEARQKTQGKGIFANPVKENAVSCVKFRPTPEHAACVCAAVTAGDGEMRFFDFAPAA